MTPLPRPPSHIRGASKTYPNLKLAFHRRSGIPILINPLRDILAVPLQPAALSMDRVQALRQSHSEALGAPLGEERLHLRLLLQAREAGCADRDHGAEHGEACREAAGQLVPVHCHPLEQRVDAVGVGAESADGHVDILLLDLVADGEGEGALDELGVLGAAERAESSVALVGVDRVAVDAEDGVVLFRLAKE